MNAFFCFELLLKVIILYLYNFGRLNLNSSLPMQLFYEPDILTNQGFLNPEESNHCVRVLRHKVGDTIHILDGKGNLFEALIQEASHKKCEVKIISTKSELSPSFMGHIAVAPTKSNDRTEWFVEKATEIGIEMITPIFSKNSERKVIKSERIEKVITSAVKQSVSLWRPQLNEAMSFADFVQQEFDGDKFIAHCLNDEEEHLQEVCIKGRNTLVVIGPEGDFTKEEVELAFQNGFRPISLGKKRLRTETAALLACCIIRLKNH